MKIRMDLYFYNWKLLNTLSQYDNSWDIRVLIIRMDKDIRDFFN